MRTPATALQALLADHAAPIGAAILIAEAAAAHVRLPGERLGDAALARRVRDSDAAIVVVHTLGPTLAHDGPLDLQIIVADPEAAPATVELLAAPPGAPWQTLARARLAPPPADTPVQAG